VGDEGVRTRFPHLADPRVPEGPENLRSVCNQREEARKLLAWKPKPREQQQSAGIHAEVRNLEMKAMLDRLQADETACLQDLGWPDEQIQTLRKEVSETPRNKLLRP
jgi:hypothetical protein